MEQEQTQQNEQFEQDNAEQDFSQNNNDPNHIVLGGNIELKGFGDVEAAQMIVVKKMVGSYLRKITDDGVDAQKLVVEKDNDTIKATLTTPEGDKTSEEKNSNLFFGLDQSLAKLKEQV